MEHKGPEKRKEVRYPVQASASIEIMGTSETTSATTSNLSESGVLLHCDQPTGFSRGDKVSCEFNVHPGRDESLPCWGIGNVVRVDGDTVAVALTAAGFEPVEPVDAMQQNPDKSEPLELPDRRRTGKERQECD